MGRQYIPRVGAVVKLREYSLYFQIDTGRREWQERIQRAHDETRAAVDTGEISEEEATRLRQKVRDDYYAWTLTHDTPDAWSNFIVLEAGSSMCKLEHTSRNPSAPDPAWAGSVPTSWIAPPIGWEAMYTIQCQTMERAREVVSSWFARGIHVWHNQDMSSFSCGGAAFTPYENGAEEAAAPHWWYGNLPTESVDASLCPSVFRVTVCTDLLPEMPFDKKLRKAWISARKAEADVTCYYDRRRGWCCFRETVVHSPIA